MTGINRTTQDSTDQASSDQARAALLAVRAEVAKAVVGQDAAVAGLLVALLCRGHILLEGVPGVAKTLLVRALAAALDIETKRVQFTPDLMPGDLTGSLVFDAAQPEFTFRQGPVFTNLLLADEINRTPPEDPVGPARGHGGAAGQRRRARPRPLPSPFMVAATQNPVEYEGTYPLPEAQLDRFLLKVSCPCRHARTRCRCCAGTPPASTRATWPRPASGRSPARPTSTRASRRCATVADLREVAGYIVDIARATRQSPSLSLGVSPRVAPPR